MVNSGSYILHIIAMLLLISIVKKSAYMERARNLRYNLTLMCVCAYAWLALWEGTTQRSSILIL